MGLEGDRTHANWTRPSLADEIAIPKPRLVERIPPVGLLGASRKTTPRAPVCVGRSSRLSLKRLAMTKPRPRKGSNVFRTNPSRNWSDPCLGLRRFKCSKDDLRYDGERPFIKKKLRAVERPLGARKRYIAQPGQHEPAKTPL